MTRTHLAERLTRPAALALLALMAMTGCVEPLPQRPSRDMTPRPDLGRDAGPHVQDLSEEMGLADMSAADRCAPGGERGDGTAAAPHLLCEQSDFERMRAEPEAHFALGQDIDIDETWRPLETFSGVFDGRGHAIAGLSLTQARIASSPCQNEQGVQAFSAHSTFITRLHGATVRDTRFVDVRLGTQDEPLRAFPYSPSGGGAEILCYPLSAGLFASISPSRGGTKRATLEGIYVERITAHVKGLFAGLVYNADDAMLTDVHILSGDDGRSRVMFQNGDVAGMIYTTARTDLTRVSADLDMIQAGTPRPHYSPGADTLGAVSLFLGRAKGIVARDVVARGSVKVAHGETRQHTPGKLAALIAHLDLTPRPDARG